MSDPRIHPRDALFDATPRPPALPVCDHYSGVEVRMRKSLELQAELGPVFDVTLDCEDGAPLGGEAEHACLAGELAAGAANRFERVGARVHPVDHASFGQDVATLVARAGHRLAYLMVPKVAGRTDVDIACAEIDRQQDACGQSRRVPVHVLIETHGALRDVEAIAAHPRVQSLSFGLMDFVSAHHGAIPAAAMGVPGQFTHPLVIRAKLAVAAACHGHGKTPSHCVVTELNDEQAIHAAARRAATELAYTRMWSIHPHQIRPIVQAFAPDPGEVQESIDILVAAQDAHWAPVRHRVGTRSTLHDRASYRYHWQLLERAQRTGQALPAPVLQRFFVTS